MNLTQRLLDPTMVVELLNAPKTSGKGASNSSMVTPISK